MGLALLGWASLSWALASLCCVSVIPSNGFDRSTTHSADSYEIYGCDYKKDGKRTVFHRYGCSDSKCTKCKNDSLLRPTVDEKGVQHSHPLEHGECVYSKGYNESHLFMCGRQMTLDELTEREEEIKEQEHEAAKKTQEDEKSRRMEEDEAEL